MILVINVCVHQQMKEDSMQKVAIWQGEGKGKNTFYSTTVTDSYREEATMH